MNSAASDQLICIESASNDRYRQLMALSRSSRERRKRERSVIEGCKLVRAYLDGADQPGDLPPLRDVFVAHKARNNDAIKAALRGYQGRVVALSDSLFRQASQMAESTGPIAIIDTPRQKLPQQLSDDFVYLDRVQDPGNIGTILRTCAAAGIRDVVTAKGTAFCWAPKVLRAAMGAHFSLRVVESVEPQLLLERVAPTVGLCVLQPLLPNRPATNLYAADLTGPAGWIFGSEGSGLRPELQAIATRQLYIPQQAGVESLNVAAAVAICLFEARRQRAAA